MTTIILLFTGALFGVLGYQCFSLVDESLRQRRQEQERAQRIHRQQSVDRDLMELGRKWEREDRERARKRSES